MNRVDRPRWARRNSPLTGFDLFEDVEEVPHDPEAGEFVRFDVVA